MTRTMLRWARALAVAAIALPAIACGQIDIPLTLVLEDPSDITINIPIFPPPNDQASTFLVGGIDTNITADLGFFELLAVLLGQALQADVDINDVAIAGTPLLIGGFLDTGTVCVDPDPVLGAGGGEAQLNVLLGVAAFDIDINTLLTVADPLVNSLLGGGLPFAAGVDTTTTFTIGDLIGLALGGGGGGLALTQEISTTLPPDTPVIGAAEVSAVLTLATSDAIPSDPLLDECAAL
ncbi:MAG: hypothetical protein QNK05_12860 [Myxococcota bacterium]|nr:hypothetical protein [Myxococcota bacterium]